MTSEVSDAALRRQLTLDTHRIHTLPVVVMMPHSRCNCRCVMCDIWKANHNHQELSRADLAAHLETFRQLRVKWVALSGGEALMHSNLWTLCELLAELGVKISLLSTGLLLAGHAEDIVRWCDEVIVSLDGSRDVHNAIRRVPRAYERLEAGVAALKALRPDFRITARSVVQRENFQDLPRIIASAHALQLDQVSFLAVDVSSQAFNRETPWSNDRVSDVALSPNEVIEFDEIVDRILRQYADDFEAGFIAESPQEMRRLPRYFRAINGQGEFPETVCNAPWVSTVIESDGTVYPCFFHPALGNIRDQPLLDVLNSEAAIDFRRKLDVKRDRICQRCVCTLNLQPEEAW